MSDDEADVISQREAFVRVDLGQSNSERANLREKLRNNMAKVTDEANTVDQLRELNAVYKNVKNTREAALDSSAIRLFSERTAKRVLANTKGSVPWKGPQDFKEQLIQILSTRSWKGVGRLATKRMRIGSSPRFMLGPLKKNTERKARVVREKKKWDSTQAAVPLEKLDSKHEKAQDFSDERVVELYNVLVREENAATSAGKEFKGLCLFELCLNPKSFSQSVENLFHLACVVKQQQAEIENDEQTGLPRVYVSEEQKKQDDDDFQEGDDDKPVSQGVFNLTWTEWRDAIKLFGIKKSILPHRKHIDEK